MYERKDGDDDVKNDVDLQSIIQTLESVRAREMNHPNSILADLHVTHLPNHIGELLVVVVVVDDVDEVIQTR